MPKFDLKPLTPEIIQQLALEPSSLWHVQLGEQKFGPFETRSLLHYARENTPTMLEARVAHWGQEDWQPFFSLPEFKKGEVHSFGGQEGPWFWILENGLKSKPHSHAEVEEKIKAGLLLRSDEVSLDEGLSWTKLSHAADFKSLFQAETELPERPIESSFHRAMTDVLHKLNHHSEEAPLKEAIPALAFVAQTIEKQNALKIEEMAVAQRSSDDVPMASSFRWAIPGFATFLLIAVGGGLYLQEEKVSDPLDVGQVVTPAVVTKTKSLNLNSAKRVARPLVRPAQREPASYDDRSSLTAQPVYNDLPTHVETHVDRNEEREQDRDRDRDRDRFDREPADQRAEADAEPKEDQSLDAAMNVSRVPSNDDNENLYPPEPSDKEASSPEKERSRDRNRGGRDDVDESPQDF